MARLITPIRARPVRARPSAMIDRKCFTAGEQRPAFHKTARQDQTLGADIVLDAAPPAPEPAAHNWHCLRELRLAVRPPLIRSASKDQPMIDDLSSWEILAN